MYRLHYLEVRYATIPPSPSLPLPVFRVLNRVCAGPIWIRGIRFQFEHERGKLPFLRTCRRVVLVYIFGVLSFGRRVVIIFAFECRRLSFRPWRLESRLPPCRVPCQPRGFKDFPQQPAQFGKGEIQAPATNADEAQPAATDNKTAPLVDALIPSPATGTRESAQTMPRQELPSISTETVQGAKLSGATTAALRSGNSFEWTWRLCRYQPYRQ